MADYIRWSLRQFYLILFWPTRFEREVESDIGDGQKLQRIERLRYLMKLLPWIIALAVIGNLIAGVICEAYGLDFNRVRSWVGVALGVAFGMAGGVAFGVARNVSFGVAGGVAFGMAGGVAFGVARGVAGRVAGDVTTDVVIDEMFYVAFVAFGMPVGVAVGVTFGVVFAVAAVEEGVASGVKFGVAEGMAFGLGSGVIVGVGVGVAFMAFVVASGVASGVAEVVVVGVVVGVVFGVSCGMGGGVTSPLAWLITYFRLASYPLDFAITTAAYLVARRSPQSSFRVWRWCPVAWNEVIWLPLPFVGRLLVLMVWQNREEAFKQIAFVAAERPLQKRAAIKAMAEIAINDVQAKSVAEVAYVTERLMWATAAPADLPDELAACLPRFAQVSQHAGQYLELHNAFRKGQALEAAVDNVVNLQKSLIVSRGKNAPRLLRAANLWCDLLQSELKTFRAQTKAERTIPNPFVFGQPVNETPNNVFAGRRDIAEQIEESLLGASQTPMLLLHGPRRMGKTSILKQLPRLLGPDFAPALLDLEKKAAREDESSLLLYFSRAVSEGLRRRHVAVEPLTEKRFTRGGPYRAFDNWLDGVEREMPPRMRALLCLDEYESLQSALAAGWGGDFLDTMRNLLQHRQRLVLMFTGAHTFAELGHEWTGRFISARRVRVSFLTRDELIPLLTEPIPEFDMRYADDGALERIIATTNGQPFLTQAIAFELVQFLNSEKRKLATLADVETAITRAMESGGEYFANVWSDTGEEGRAILLAIAEGKTPPDFPSAENRLRDHDLLNGAGQFAVPMVERWVREKASVTTRPWKRSREKA